MNVDWRPEGYVAVQYVDGKGFIPLYNFGEKQGDAILFCRNPGRYVSESKMERRMGNYAPEEIYMIKTNHITAKAVLYRDYEEERLRDR